MQKVIEFILEIDKLKGVTRKNRPLGMERYENAAEHSWQIALFACCLAPYAAQPVDIQRVINMLLVHDIGEIDTGDTLVYDEEGLEERTRAEKSAARRIFNLLEASQADNFMDLWIEFEAAVTPEARFAHAVDRAIPALLNLSSHGQSWRENGISYQQVIRRIGPPIKAGCPALWHYLAPRLEEEYRRGWFDRSKLESDEVSD